ncbi:TetR/AcrR family transcriptional regulator [Mucilaginibacter aquatilis]|uniref:TetR family transcriptional regulator n=1 Tax=Mucilaginibacter aquatilis TaxID=1517760 RepID=A0A6I4I6Q5_9SPHI|nr:TetR/AcrR family transcriptional regulator [Mucilaginibacter aquatilis]MVN89818.1 TetR family transcriptional regulator [Mucilaginibacter aquatilis]
MSKAAVTRLSILQKAFEFIYRKGYQATSIDDIVATTQVTKGAFFYHFRNKEEMGLAMISEVMHPGMIEAMIKPLVVAEDPATEIYAMMKGLLQSPMFDVRYGCPAINLIEEMSPLNAQFNKALYKLFSEWTQAIQHVVEQGIKTGRFNKITDSQQVVYFIISGYGGIRNMGKLLGADAYQIYLKELKNYLNSLA